MAVKTASTGRLLLFLSQADRGAKARRMPVQSLAQLCAEVADYYEAVLIESDLQWSIEGDASGQYDAALLRRVLSNLLNNAAVCGSRKFNRDSYRRGNSWTHQALGDQSRGTDFC